MSYVSIICMEVALISKKSLRIKGKNAVLSVDPDSKFESNAALFLDKEPQGKYVVGAEVVINGPGEYETGGIKISGVKHDDNLVYSMTVDNVGILLGKLTTLEKLHTKLKEANILVVNCDNVSDASFLTALVTNVVIFYGDKATEICKAFGQENPKTAKQFSTTVEKLPAEVETVILE